jgi:hypothetical protein
MLRVVLRLFIPPFIAASVAMCTREIVTWEEPPRAGDEDDGNPSQPDDDDDEGEDDDGDDDIDLGAAVQIPPGKMPPPGSCRIWYPGRPAGQQPPPGRCDELRGRVPPDAWLLYRPTAEPKVYRVR